MITPLFTFAAICFLSGALVLRILNTDFKKRERYINDEMTMKEYRRWFGFRE